MADRGTSFDRALAIVTAFEAAGETSAARMLLLTQIQDLIDAADAARAGASKGDLTMGDHFCIVWNPDGMRPPRFRHDTVDSATREAIRLGTENPGQTFHVLENIGHAKTPAAVFTSVYPTHLVITESNIGFVTAGAATGRAVAFESTPNPHGDDIWQQFRNSRGATHIIAEADYIPGVKLKDGGPEDDTLERAGAEVIRLRTWLHRILEATSGSGGISPRQRAIIHTACTEALTCEPPPFPNQAKASLPGFEDSRTNEVGEKPWLPNDDGWIEWSGGDNPAPKETVDVLLREDRVARKFKSSGLVSAVWQWNWKGDGRDVVAYRIRRRYKEAAPHDTNSSLVFPGSISDPPVYSIRALEHGEYLPGDRVRFTHRSGGRDLGVGRLGTVVEGSDTSRNCTPVRWDEIDGRKEECWGPYTGSIEHESLPQFEVGDEVEYSETSARLIVRSIDKFGRLDLVREDDSSPAALVYPTSVRLICPVQRLGRAG